MLHLCYTTAAAAVHVFAECLKELNESVSGSYVDESPRSLMDTNPDFFKQFTLVLATQACDWSKLLALFIVQHSYSTLVILSNTQSMLGPDPRCEFALPLPFLY